MGADAATGTRATNGKTALARTLNLPLAILFGLGVTIGAGIYVLIGSAAGRAGMHAPIAFLIAAVVMAPTAAVFAELVTRMPVSAGEAAYVGAGFNSRRLSLLVGLMVMAVGVLSAAAISRGSAGYIAALTGARTSHIIPAVVLVMGLITAWGIKESVTVAATMTVIEITGLVAIIVVGAWNSPAVFARIPEVWSGTTSLAVMSGVFSASLLAFFAFIGFESLANIAEEIKEPERLLPRAIFWTLVLSTLLYISVVWVALVAVPREDLASSGAPLSLVFERVTGASPTLITVIAIVATINGIIVQMVMASRVVYGLADKGELPALFGTVHPLTRTPLNATLLVTVATLVSATAFPIEALAEATSRVTLVIFAFVNASLVLIKRRREPSTGFAVPDWVPMVGCGLCVALLAIDVAG